MKLQFIFQLSLLCSVPLSSLASEAQELAVQKASKQVVQKPAARTLMLPLELASRAYQAGIGAVGLLTVLCSQGAAQELTELLKSKLPPLSDQNKHDLLAITCINDYKDIAEILWSHGFRFIPKEKNNALKSALVNASQEVLSFFLANDPTVDVNQLFRDAIELQKNGLALWLWKEKGAQLTRQDHCRPHNTPMHIAAMNNPEFMEFLLEGIQPLDLQKLRLEDVNLLLRGNVWGSTPLHGAAACGQIAAVRKLLGLGVPVDILDYIGNTPLLRAARGGHKDVAVELVERGANIEHANGHGHGVFNTAKDENVSEDRYLAALAWLRTKLAEQKQQTATQQGIKKAEQEVRFAGPYI